MVALGHCSSIRVGVPPGPSFPFVNVCVSFLMSPHQSLGFGRVGSGTWDLMYNHQGGGQRQRGAGAEESQPVGGEELAVPLTHSSSSPLPCCDVHSDTPSWGNTQTPPAQDARHRTATPKKTHTPNSNLPDDEVQTTRSQADSHDQTHTPPHASAQG